MNSLVEKLKGKIAKRPKSSLVGPIGIHFANEQAHAVQLRRLSSGALCLRAWASVEYPEGRQECLQNAASMKQLMGQMIGRMRFRGNKVVTALPPEMAQITSLNFRVNSDVSEAREILKLMAKRLDGDISDYLIDYLPVRADESDRDKIVLATSCKRSDAVDFLELLRKCGLDVTELEIGPAALNRVVGQLRKSSTKPDNVMVVNFGIESTYLTLISGRRLLMDKEIDIGSRQLVEQIARGLDIDTESADQFVLRDGLTEPVGAADDYAGDVSNPVIEFVGPQFARLSEEIRRASLYAASITRGDSVKQIYMFGTVARWPGAAEFLSNMTHIPAAQSLQLTAIFDGDLDSGVASYAGIGPELAIATGLALRGLSDDE